VGTPLDQLDDDALDQLPFGVVCLDADGTVLRFNRREAERMGMQRWRVIGRPYFRDVAPGLADPVGALAPGDHARVRHTFRGYHRTDDAVIEMSRCETGRVYLCIRRTA